LHRLTVSDPWFGEYALLTLPLGTPIRVLLGPLYQRTIRLEAISNHGPRARLGKSIEKSCQHNYVEGTITGSVESEEWKHYPNFWYGLGGGNWETTSDVWFCESFPEYGKMHYLTKLDVVTSETDEGFGAAVTFRVEEWSLPDMWWHMYAEYTCSATFAKASLPDGAVSYSLVSASSTTTGDMPHVDWVAGTVSSPFGEGGDSLATVFQQLPRVVEEVEDIVERAGKRVSARDGAIYDALSSIQLADLNPLEEIETILAPLAPLRQLYGLIRGTNGSFIGIVKAISSLYLFYQYVVKCGIMSIGEWQRLLDALCHPDKFKLQMKSVLLQGRGRATKRLTDSGVDITITQNVKLTYGRGGMDILDLANLLGLTPRLGDLWDVVPYSFVVDWIIPIGDAINNLELANLQQKLDFLSGIGTVKTVGNYKRSFEVGLHKFDLDLRVVSYDRAVWQRFPTDVWLGVSFPGNPAKHVLAGGALLVQFLAK